jgi:quercetin dioxygenase-like cupin family protein
MVAVSIVGPGEGEIIASGPLQIRILEDGSNTDHRLGIGILPLAPHTAGPPQHRHAQHDEGFYVLSGNVRFTVGADNYDVGAGTWVTVPPGAPHTFGNVSDDPAVMLTTFTPDLYVHYFREIKALVDSGQPMTRETMAPIWKNYATEPSTEFAT